MDEGDARDLVALLRRELRPTPGRLGDCLRIVGVVLALVAIAETFRISEIALSGYIVLFVSGREAVTTILTALLAGIAVVLAIFVTIAVFMLSLSEPALRVPLMAAMTFVAMFLSRTATPGPVFFVAGFIIAYGLTMGDQVLGLALQPATAANAEQFALPEIVFGPPEEALVRFLLWLSLAVALPIILVIVANLLTGRDPARLLYQALAERLATAARFCAGESGAERRLEAQAFEGTAQLHKLHHLAGLLHRGRPRLVWGASLIDEIGRLGLLLLAWFRVAGDARNPLVPAAVACRRGGTRPARRRGPERRTGHHHRDRRRPTGGRPDLAHAASDRGDIGGNGGGAGSAWRGEGDASAAGGGCVHQPGTRPLRPQGHAGGDDLLFRHEHDRLAGHPHLRHHLLLRRPRHRRRHDPQGDAALHRLPDRCRRSASARSCC